MQIHQGLTALRNLPPRSAMSIGNFDGLHRGHASLIQRAIELRDSGKAERVAIVTFEPHPFTVLRPQRIPPRLTTSPQRRAMLEAMGVDDLVELAPSRDLLDLSAEAFWKIIRDEVQPAQLIEGDTFNFGKDRGGTINVLREWASSSDIKLHVEPPVCTALCDLTVVDISSSLIRWLIEQGRARDAMIGLGRPFSLIGKVVKGFQRGRTIGVPTANLLCDDPTQIVPGEGVYAGNALVDGEKFPAAISVGRLPTFAENVRQVEAHLIDVRVAELYEKPMEVQFTDWMREQRKYASIDTLKAQLTIDIDEARLRSARFDAKAQPEFAYSLST